MTENSVLMEPESFHRCRQQSRQRALDVNPFNPRNSPQPTPVSTSSSDNQAYLIWRQQKGFQYTRRHSKPLNKGVIIHILFYFLLTVNLDNLSNENQLDVLFILNLFHQTTSTCFGRIYCPSSGDKKGKAIPLQASTSPEGSRRLRPPDFKTIGT
jgi:hypothetical protein